MVIQIQKIILILVRITAFIVVCPGFSFKGLPNTLKIALSVSLSMIVYTIVPDIQTTESLLLLFMWAIKETLFGLGMGYVTNMVFTTMEIAGQLVDFQVGFSMASVFDASMGKQASIFGRIYYWITISVFFLLNMHHIVLEALIKSFDYMPLTMLNVASFKVEGIVVLFSNVFELALNLAAPIIIVVLITDIVLGVISRTVPQINVLMLGMPLKSMVGFVITMATLSYLMNSITNIVEIMPEYMYKFMKMFG